MTALTKMLTCMANAFRATETGPFSASQAAISEETNNKMSPFKSPVFPNWYNGLFSNLNWTRKKQHPSIWTACSSSSNHWTCSKSPCWFSKSKESLLLSGLKHFLSKKSYQHVCHCFLSSSLPPYLVHPLTTLIFGQLHGAVDVGLHLASCEVTIMLTSAVGIVALRLKAA